MTPLEEKVARAIADQIGPSYDDAYEDKREWTADRGKRHDVNTPYKCDFRNAAQAAIAVVVEAMREPTREMLDDGETAVENAIDSTQDSESTYIIEQPMRWAAAGYKAMIESFIKAALSPTTPEGRGEVDPNNDPVQLLREAVEWFDRHRPAWGPGTLPTWYFDATRFLRGTKNEGERLALIGREMMERERRRQKNAPPICVKCLGTGVGPMKTAGSMDCPACGGTGIKTHADAPEGRG